MGLFVWIVAAVLLIGCLLLFCVARCRCSRKEEVGTTSNVVHTTPSEAPPIPLLAISTGGMKALNREAVRALLKNLSDSPKPKVERVFAMCYMVESPPCRADYVCPKCGERTLYDIAAGKDKSRQARQKQQEIIDFVDDGLAACREEIEQSRKVAGDSISLDESQFCRKCSPKVSAPKLVLHISYQGEKTRDIEGISHGDLRILTDFLSGKLLSKGERDEMFALKKSLPRLEELLGMKLGK